MDILEQLRKQDRLLSESAVMKSVQKAIIEMGYEPFEEKVMGIYTAIDNTPIAYDVEKVVAELEEERKIAEKEMEECIFKALPYHNSTEGKVIGIKKAIDIVKRGGAE